MDTSRINEVKAPQHRGTLSLVLVDRPLREFERSDTNDDKWLDLTEVTQLLNRINYFKSKRYIKAMFDAADENNDGALDFAEFRQMITQLRRRQEVCVCV